MRRFLSAGALMVLACLVLIDPVRADMTYVEEVTASACHRSTRTNGPERATMLDTSLAGNIDFDRPFNHLVFSHLFLPLSQTLPGDLLIRSMALRIALRNGAGEEIELSIDSLSSRLFTRRTFPLGPGKDDYITLVQSPVADSELFVVLNSPDESFTVQKAKLTIRFDIATPVKLSGPKGAGGSSGSLAPGGAKQLHGAKGDLIDPRRALLQR